MTGHKPYNTWQMYYYHRPYQMQQVVNVSEAAGVVGILQNAYSNEIFRRLHVDYAERFALTADTRNLEFAGRTLPPVLPPSALDPSMESDDLPEPSSVDSHDFDVAPELNDHPIDDATDDATIVNPPAGSLGQR